MSVNEPDFELLEAYLDDELSEVQADDLRRRIEQDATLAEALETLRAERSIRQRYWEALEPGASEADQFAAGVVDDARTRERTARRLRRVKRSAAVAACVGMFVLGRISLRPAGEPPDVRKAPIVASDRPVTPAIAVQAPKPQPLPIDDEPPREIQFYAKTDGVNVTPDAGHDVVLTDESGRVVAVQHFSTPQEAAEFSKDLKLWQTRTREARDGVIVPASREQF